MNGLDWILIGIGLFCTLRGLMRGAISQIFGIAGVLGGFLLAAHFYDPLAKQLLVAFPKLSGAQLISFIILFFLTWFCVGVVGFWIARILHRTGLGFLDRLTGGAVGLGKALILALILISVLTLVLSPKSPFLNHSYLVPHVQEVARYVIQATPRSVQDLFDGKRREFDRYWSNRKDESPKREPAKKKETGI